MRSPSCSNAMHRDRGGAMNEDQLRRRLIEDGMTWEEAEEEIASLASDAYDREQDRLAEEYFRNKEQSK